MSQYGAEAMARSGSTAAEIVAHYYGGLSPVVDSQALPARVRVGLTIGSPNVSIQPNGPVGIEIDGQTIADSVLGSWSFESDGASMRINPPAGLGLPPELLDIDVLVDGAGRPEIIAGRLRAAAEVRTIVTVGSRVAVVSDWEIREAGSLATLLQPMRSDVPIRITIESRSPDGADSVTVVVLARAD